MPIYLFCAYRREMLPDWLDYDRLQMMLAGLGVLALALALVCLALTRPTALKVVAMVGFGAIALGAGWQLQEIADARRADCSDVEVLGSRVVVPACPVATT
jgi:hypothetical protein